MARKSSTGRRLSQNIKKRKEKVKKNLPNIFTFTNLILGFISIIYAIDGDFKIASMLLFLAVVFDMLDGLVARKLGLSSDLGIELDSMADSISFVIAPAILSYAYFFNFSKFYLFVMAVIIISGILRLAIFNLSSSKKYFTGMPTPFFALPTAALVLFEAKIHPYMMSAILIIMSYFMISKIRYPSFKAKEFLRYKYTGVAAFVIVVLLLSAKINLLYVILAEYALVIIILLYFLSQKLFHHKGPLMTYLVLFILLVASMYSLGLEPNHLFAVPLVYLAVFSPLIQYSVKEGDD